MSGSISRSYLFVPANRIDRVKKAHAAGAHAVIVDLEDAVPPEEKASGRNAVATGLSGVAPVLVRINGPDTEWFEEDLRLCATENIQGVVIPKAESADQLRYVAHRLGAGAHIFPLMETAQGYSHLGELCGAPKVRCLMFGTVDFQLDLGISGDGEELLFFRSGLVLASRTANIQPPVDGVTLAIDDAESVRGDALRAKRLGFGGKLCIHPKQVTPVNECFRPGADEIIWARKIVEASAVAKGGAVAVDGRMVDRPVILKAEEILRGVEL